jgi:phosphoribosylanthranilate isomerase
MLKARVSIMTKIKICGLSRFEDIVYVNKLMPDYVGFVFANSKRQVKMEHARELIKGLHGSINTVGVFVNEDIDIVKNIARNLSLKVLQFHGKEDKQYIENFKGLQVWKCVGINTGSESSELNYELMENQKKIDETSQFSVHGILLDSITKGNSGGTGVTFNWNIIDTLKTNKPLILAGGLNCQNVREAILKVNPYAVDVSGGVEVNGVKNYEKIKEFIDKVRELV